MISVNLQEIGTGPARTFFDDWTDILLIRYMPSKVKVRLAVTQGQRKPSVPYTTCPRRWSQVHNQAKQMTRLEASIYSEAL
jgi:hypothetical protein